jgi:hypothetical protein
MPTAVTALASLDAVACAMLVESIDDELEACRNASIMIGRSTIRPKPRVMSSSRLDWDF